jgi:Mlc titration factor MtfA (ptsG expression regulator)
VISPAVAAILVLALMVLAWLLAAPLLRARRLRHAAATPLSDSRVALLARNVPIRARLPAELRERLDGLVNAFVAEKSFVGCNGLSVTDEMRVTIAAHACALVLGRPHDLYPALQSILVYPTPFWVDEEDEDDAGVVSRHRRVLSGQAWDASRIILSWEDVTEAAGAPSCGYNLVLHEFAHHLEYEGRGLARPADDGSRRLEAWRSELKDEFDRLLEAVDEGEDTFLDPYAAEDESEFFAVASEEYFERPVMLQASHPALYGLLREFYGLDPAKWPAA